jgi:hypothetical protein
MATSPNFGWLEPDNTDLVKNGALAIRTAVNAIDTSMGDLLGGTTGQVLSKNSNTNMDFTWVAQDDSNAIQNAIVDAKGDLIAATANDTPARLAVGSDYAILSALGSEATGLKWSGKATSWTPSWEVQSGTNPTLGNGTIVANYVRTGDLVYFAIQLTFGTTTNAGSGAYIFTLPVAMSNTRNGFTGSVEVLNDGVAWYRGFTPVSVEAGYTDRFFMISDAGTTVSNSNPITFGNLDRLYVWGIYNV